MRDEEEEEGERPGVFLPGDGGAKKKRKPNVRGEGVNTFIHLKKQERKRILRGRKRL